MRVKTMEGDEHTGVYLPHQIAPQVLEALRQAEPELAEVKMAGGGFCNTCLPPNT